jgi:nucleoside kinase
MRDLICFGEITRDDVGASTLPPIEGSASILDAHGTFYGGRGANAATFFALWGGSVALLSAAGEDFVQAGHRDLLESRGVHCSGVLIEKDRPTPRAFVFNTGGASQTYFFRAANSQADAVLAGHVQQAAEDSHARALYCTSGHQDLNFSLLTQLSCEIRAYAPGPQVFHYPQAELEPFLRAANALFLNQGEAEYLRATFGMDAATLSREYGLIFQAVTRGPAGCTVQEGTRELSLPACRPDAETDPTGAGDAFAGTFLAEYLRTGDPRAAAELALAVSSFVVERLGCQENVPTPEQARERLREYQAGRRLHP